MCHRMTEWLSAPGVAQKQCEKFTNLLELFFFSPPTGNYKSLYKDIISFLNQSTVFNPLSTFSRYLYPFVAWYVDTAQRLHSKTWSWTQKAHIVACCGSLDVCMLSATGLISCNSNHAFWGWLIHTLIAISVSSVSWLNWNRWLWLVELRDTATQTHRQIQENI